VAGSLLDQIPGRKEGQAESMRTEPMSRQSGLAKSATQLSPRHEKLQKQARLLMKKCKLKQLVSKEKQERKINYKRLEEIKGELKQSNKIYAKIGHRDAAIKPHVPMLREKNMRRPHSIQNGSSSYFVQNPMATKHQQMLRNYSDLPFLKSNCENESYVQTDNSPQARLLELRQSLTESKLPIEKKLEIQKQAERARLIKRAKVKKHIHKPALPPKYTPSIRTASQGALFLNQLRDEKHFIPNRETILSQLDLDQNMQLDFDKLDRQNIPADILIKFKWRIILQLMDSKGQQVEYLLENLQKLIAEIKEESKSIKLDENGNPKWVRRCRGCRKKLVLKEKYHGQLQQVAREAKLAKKENRAFNLTLALRDGKEG